MEKCTERERKMTNVWLRGIDMKKRSKKFLHFHCNDFATVNDLNFMLLESFIKKMSRKS
jgi:hypothetical protein